MWPFGGHLQEARDCHAHVSATEPAAESGIGNGPACMPTCLPARLHKQVRKHPADFLLNCSAGGFGSALLQKCPASWSCQSGFLPRPDARDCHLGSKKMGAPRVVDKWMDLKGLAVGVCEDMLLGSVYRTA